ncbi:hypothetical protein [Actinomadura chokoriensis]|uniref:hypothetical protein n=1 Tax=Actinomadura chokoriensis TaxID=454156 RepID=UPI0031F980C9
MRVAVGPARHPVRRWLRSVEHIRSFEAALRRRFPRLTVTDRAVALWQLKLAGQLLDPRGRHLRTVPFWTWDAPGTAAELDVLVDRLRTGPPPPPDAPSRRDAGCLYRGVPPATVPPDHGRRAAVIPPGGRGGRPGNRAVEGYSVRKAEL